MRYLKLWLSFLKMSWMADLEYRLNVIIRVFGEAGWYIAQLSVFEVLYLHTKTISGWDVHAMRVFMGSLFLVDVLYMILNQENIEGLFSMIRKGELDLYLAKPVNSQFMVSLRKMTTAYFLNLIFILAYLIWAIHDLVTPATPLQILTFIFLILTGAVLQYSMRFMFATLTVILQDAGNIHFIWHQLYRLATKPDPIFPMFMRVLIFTIFPVAFFASVPSRIFVEGLEPGLIVASVILAGGGLWASSRFWKYALKHYASASS